MTVIWSYKGQSSRRKRSTSTNVSVVIYYQPDGGEEAHYPLQGSVAAEDRQVTINGQFDVEAKYKVWLKVYEGLLVVSSQQTEPFEAAVEKANGAGKKKIYYWKSIVILAKAFFYHACMHEFCHMTLAPACSKR